MRTKKILMMVFLIAVVCVCSLNIDVNARASVKRNSGVTFFGSTAATKEEEPKKETPKVEEPKKEEQKKEVKKINIPKKEDKPKVSKRKYPKAGLQGKYIHIVLASITIISTVYFAVRYKKAGNTKDLA